MVREVYLLLRRNFESLPLCSYQIDPRRQSRCERLLSAIRYPLIPYRLRSDCDARLSYELYAVLRLSSAIFRSGL